MLEQQMQAARHDLQQASEERTAASASYEQKWEDFTAVKQELEQIEERSNQHLLPADSKFWGDLFTVISASSIAALLQGKTINPAENQAKPGRK